MYGSKQHQQYTIFFFISVVLRFTRMQCMVDFTIRLFSFLISSTRFEYGDSKKEVIHDSKRHKIFI